MDATLERLLNSVAWNTIAHACGEDSAVIPQLIRAVIENPADAESADQLSENLNHQGSIYPATMPALPALLRAAVLVRPTSVGHQRLLYLIASIGHRLKDAKQLGMAAATGWIREWSEHVATFDFRIHTEVEDPATRDCAALLLASALWVEPMNLSRVQLLFELFERERHPVVQATYLFGLEPVLPNAEGTTFLARASIGDGAPGLAAALVLARSPARPELPRKALMRLEACVLRGWDGPDAHVFQACAGDKEVWRSAYAFRAPRRLALDALVTWAHDDQARHEHLVPIYRMEIEEAHGEDVRPLHEVILPGILPKDRVGKWEMVGGLVKFEPPAMLQPEQVTPALRAVLLTLFRTENKLLDAQGHCPSLERLGIPATWAEVERLIGLPTEGVDIVDEVLMGLSASEYEAMASNERRAAYEPWLMDLADWMDNDEGQLAAKLEELAQQLENISFCQLRMRLIELVRTARRTVQPNC